jgi:hypothetical protein
MARRGSVEALQLTVAVIDPFCTYERRTRASPALAKQEARGEGEKGESRAPAVVEQAGR